MSHSVLRQGGVGFKRCLPSVKGRLPPFPNDPVLFCKVENVTRNRSELVQVGVFVLRLIKDAVVKVGLPSEVRNPFKGAVK